METSSKKVIYGSVIANLLLSLLKLMAGILGKSQALVSDAFHSASDVFSTFIVLIGMKISHKKADKHHPYGHERLECISAQILSSILFATGLMIGYQGIVCIYTKSYLTNPLPQTITIYVALLSIFVKEVMFQMTRKQAKKINSPSLMADAWHHCSDALSSIGSLFGIVLTRAHFLLGDALASFVISIFIIKAAIDIFKDASDKLIDKSCDKATIRKIKQVALKVVGVKRVDRLMTRQFGSKIYVDIEIAVEGSMQLFVAHAIAEDVHRQIEKMDENIKHCMVHVNPYE